MDLSMKVSHLKADLALETAAAPGFRLQTPLRMATLALVMRWSVLAALAGPSLTFDPPTERR